MSKPKGNLRLPQRPAEATAAPSPAMTRLQTLQAGREAQTDQKNALDEAFQGSAGGILRAEYAGAINALTPAQRNAIKAYSGQSFTDINARLRKGISFDGAPSNRVTLENLDALFQTARNAHPLTVYRGMVLKPDTDLAKAIRDSAVGSTFTDKGFTSTSADPRFAKGWIDEGIYGKDVAVVARIRVPAGTRSIYAGAASNYGDKETEVLLNRGLNYRINSVSYSKVAGYYTADIEVIP